MGEIIELDTSVILIESLSGDVHLVPESFIREVLRGDKSITQLAGWEDVVNGLLWDKLESVYEEG